MVRTTLLALALALGGGAPHPDSSPGLVPALWAADEVDTDAGNSADPNGAAATGDAGGSYDPNGAAATGDAGNILDPNG